MRIRDKNSRMRAITGKRILFLNWKDITNPSAGGAEVLTDALASHLAQENDVTYFTSVYPNAQKKEQIHGYTVIRHGNIYTTYLHAFLWWHWNVLYGKPYDLIIDQVHGIPFFSILYIHHPKILTLIHEVAGDLWSNILPRIIGNNIDTVWLFLYKNQQFITVSNSTKQELISRQIKNSHIYIIQNFTDIRLATIPKKPLPTTLIVLGRIAPVKRIEHAIHAFQEAKKNIPNLQLVIIGKVEHAYQSYYQKIQDLVLQNPDITLLENATEETKIDWLKKSYLLLMTSKKEGYGIAILEAGACGVPAIGYKVPGIQDAIIHMTTGVLVEEEIPHTVARQIYNLVHNSDQYKLLQHNVFAHATMRARKATLLAFEHIIHATIFNN